jgi:hypothetical protein
MASISSDNGTEDASVDEFVAVVHNPRAPFDRFPFEFPETTIEYNQIGNGGDISVFFVNAKWKFSAEEFEQVKQKLPEYEFFDGDRGKEGEIIFSSEVEAIFPGALEALGKVKRLMFGQQYQYQYRAIDECMTFWIDNNGILNTDEKGSEFDGPGLSDYAAVWRDGNWHFHALI